MNEAGLVRLAHQLGRELRQSQTRRIRTNLNPEGSAYEPLRAEARKHRINKRAKTGPMFRRQLGQTSALEWEASAEGISIGFVDAGLQQIARVHQFGLRHKVTRFGKAEAQYPARQLIGLTAAERARILDLVPEHLGR